MGTVQAQHIIHVTLSGGSKGEGTPPYLAHSLSRFEELLSVVEGEGALSSEDVADSQTEFFELDLDSVFFWTELCHGFADFCELIEGRDEVLHFSVTEYAGDKEAGGVDEVSDDLITLVFEYLQQAYRSLTTGTTETESAQL
jgi:hypothetical protein